MLLGVEQEVTNASAATADRVVISLFIVCVCLSPDESPDSRLADVCRFASGNRHFTAELARCIDRIHHFHQLQRLFRIFHGRRNPTDRLDEIPGLKLKTVALVR